MVLRIAWFAPLLPLLALAFAPPPTKKPVGVAFTDTGGKHSAPAKNTVYVFLATDCPVASRIAPLVARLAKVFAKRGVRVVAVYPNALETEDGVRRHARERGLPAAHVAVLRDSSGNLARTFGAAQSPEAVLLGRSGKTVYRGSVESLTAAVNALLAGRPVPAQTVRVAGCALRLRAAPVGRRPAEPHPPSPSPKQRGGVDAGGASVAIARLWEVSPLADDGRPTQRVPAGVGGQPNDGGQDRAARSQYAAIAPVLARHCVPCHRAGEVGPMPLDTYQSAASWAKAMADYTARREMPPWKADSHGEFLNERRLTDAEIAAFAAFATAPVFQTAPPNRDTAAQTTSKAAKIGQAAPNAPPPDAVFTMPTAYTTPAEGKDVYRCFVLPTDYDGDKWVSEIAFAPGNRAIVHHVNVWLDTSGAAKRLDAADPAPGYSSPNPGNVPGFVSAGVLGGWVPGHTPWKLPPGVGNLLPRGADIVLEVHYITTGKPETDRSGFALTWVKGAVKKRLHLGEVTAKGFTIPAGETRYTVNTSEFVREPITLLSVTPHMHNLGVSMTATAQFPDDTNLRLIAVNHWDFAWQMSYRYKEPVRLPQNTRIDVTAVFDNSAANPKNPNRPPKTVRDGAKTSDEMCNLFIAYTVD